jgi:flagellar motor protein MotB
MKLFLYACIFALAHTFSAEAIAAPFNKYAVAVIIGNTNYQGRIPSVDFAGNDADAFKKFVIEVQGYDPENVIDLRDATQAQIQSLFGNSRSHEGKLWRYIDPKGRSDVTVFYSGHGVPGLKDRRGYLLPIDADPNAPEINGFPLDLLLTNLNTLKTKSMTVLLEACFSGDSEKGMLIRSTSGITIAPRMPKRSSNMTVITAAQGDQVASWDFAAKHGIFTKHLLEALYGAADQSDLGNADGNITLGEVSSYLDEKVTRTARRNYGRHQNAWVNGDENKVFVREYPKTLIAIKKLKADRFVAAKAKEASRKMVIQIRTMEEQLRTEREASKMALTEARSLKQQIAIVRQQLTRTKKAEAPSSKMAEQLRAERKVSEAALRQIVLLNQQIAAMRQQMARISRGLEASEAMNSEQKGTILKVNRRLSAALTKKVEKLSRYRSEFFGQLRAALGNRKDVRVVGDRFVIQSEVLFSRGSADLGGAGEQQLTKIAKTILNVGPKIPSKLPWVIRVDGHTDTDSVGDGERLSNWELSTQRALSVVNYLIKQGVPPNRLAAAGFGEFHPLDTNHDQIAYRRNRRIEVKLTTR